MKPGFKIDIQKIDYTRLPFADGSFDAVLAIGRVPLSLIAALTASRRLLVPNGRVVLTYPVKVGRFPAKLVTDVWDERLGEPLLLPRDALLRAERAGFEPESIETLNDAELGAYYQDFERALAASPAGSEEQLAAARQELELHKSSGAKASVSFGLLFARRKEAGEKPSASRDVG